jgi:hypothetical protein
MLIPLQWRKTPFHPPLAKGGFVVLLSLEGRDRSEGEINNPFRGG